MFGDSRKSLGLYELQIEDYKTLKNKSVYQNKTYYQKGENQIAIHSVMWAELFPNIGEINKFGFD